jgi:hypothetical protein
MLERLSFLEVVSSTMCGGLSVLYNVGNQRQKPKSKQTKEIVMKKAGRIAVMAVVGFLGACVLQAATIETIELRDLRPDQKDQKEMVRKLNANTVAINAQVTNSPAAVTSGVSKVSTVVTGLTASAYATNIVSVAPMTNVVIQTVDVTNAAGTVSACMTNMIIQYGAAPTLQTATPTATTAAFGMTQGIVTNAP